MLCGQQTSFFWLAFYPVTPNFNDSFYSCLNYRYHDLPMKGVEVKPLSDELYILWQLNSHIQRKWQALETVLCYIVGIISSRKACALSIRFPVEPSEYTYNQVYDTKASVCKAASHAKDTFLLLLTFISCMMRINEDWHKNAYTKLPGGSDILLRGTWLINTWVQYVGLFVNAVPTQCQPKPQWLGYLAQFALWPGIPLFVHFGSIWMQLEDIHPALQSLLPLQNVASEAITRVWIVWPLPSTMTLGVTPDYGNPFLYMP